MQNGFQEEAECIEGVNRDRAMVVLQWWSERGDWHLAKKACMDLIISYFHTLVALTSSKLGCWHYLAHMASNYLE